MRRVREARTCVTDKGGWGVWFPNSGLCSCTGESFIQGLMASWNRAMTAEKRRTFGQAFGVANRIPNACVVNIPMTIDSCVSTAMLGAISGGESSGR